MNRPLRPTQLADLVDTLRALADEYEADHAQQVQHGIGTETDAGYPATTSGAGGAGGAGATASRPEALTIQPDRTATQAATLLAMQATIARYAPLVLRGLRSRNPGRKIRSCPRCNHVIPDGQTRCNRMTDNGRCGECRDCGRILEVGEKSRQGRCNACDITHRRADKNAAQPRRTGAVASVANLVDGMDHIEVTD